MKVGMMESLEHVTESVESFARANSGGYWGFRRRAVLTREDDGWVLLLCTVEGVPRDGRDEPALTEPMIYPEAILHEDWLPLEALPAFMQDVSKGSMRFGQFPVSAPSGNYVWNQEQGGSAGLFMHSRGRVYSARLGHRSPSMTEPLFALDQPLFPTLADAVRYWVSFPVYHGQSDARNGSVVLMLPETRAFFGAISRLGNELTIQVEGSGAGTESLVLKGAWFDGDTIRHFERCSPDHACRIPIPEGADRVHCVLIDRTNTMYDSAYMGPPSGEGRLADIVWAARRAGEGPTVEFKPGLRMEGRNGKWAEVCRATVAFANEKGGRIFFGIADDGSIEGIERIVANEMQTNPDATACERYLGKLRAKVVERILGNVSVDIDFAWVDGQLVGILTVGQVVGEPACIRQDQYFYVRRGASNIKLSPQEWRTHLESRNPTYLI